jgi:hypothetical protein
MDAEPPFTDHAIPAAGGRRRYTVRGPWGHEPPQHGRRPVLDQVGLAVPPTIVPARVASKPKLLTSASPTPPRLMRCAAVAIFAHAVLAQGQNCTLVAHPGWSAGSYTPVPAGWGLGSDGQAVCEFPNRGSGNGEPFARSCPAVRFGVPTSVVRGCCGGRWGTDPICGCMPLPATQIHWWTIHRCCSF